MTGRTPISRLSRGLGPIGVVGSLLLHGAVLATLLHAPLPRAPLPTEAPRMTVELIAGAEPAAAPVPPLAQQSAPPAEPPTAPARNAVPSPASPVRAQPKPAKPPPRPAAVAPPAPSPMEPSPSVTENAPAAHPEGASEPPSPEPMALTNPTFRSRTPPAYPAQALRDELEGSVRLKLLIAPEGGVTEAWVLRSSGHRSLDQAALAAARHWQLTPASRNGTPVSAWAEVEVPFRLTD